MSLSLRSVYFNVARHFHCDTNHMGPVDLHLNEVINQKGNTMWRICADPKFQLFGRIYKFYHALSFPCLKLRWKILVKIALKVGHVFYWNPKIWRNRNERNRCGILGFLAATKQLYECYFPSVCPSVCLSVTPFWLCSHHCIITKFSGIITNDRSYVHAKSHSQRSKVKVTEVTTQFNRFRTVSPV